MAHTALLCLWLLHSASVSFFVAWAGGWLPSDHLLASFRNAMPPRQTGAPQPSLHCTLLCPFTGHDFVFVGRRPIGNSRIGLPRPSQKHVLEKRIWTKESSRVVSWICRSGWPLERVLLRVMVRTLWL